MSDDGDKYPVFVLDDTQYVPFATTFNKIQYSNESIAIDASTIAQGVSQLTFKDVKDLGTVLEVQDENVSGVATEVESFHKDFKNYSNNMEKDVSSIEKQQTVIEANIEANTTAVTTAGTTIAGAITTEAATVTTAIASAATAVDAAVAAGSAAAVSAVSAASTAIVAANSATQTALAAKLDSLEAQLKDTNSHCSDIYNIVDQFYIDNYNSLSQVIELLSGIKTMLPTIVNNAPQQILSLLQEAMPTSEVHRADESTVNERVLTVNVTGRHPVNHRFETITSYHDQEATTTRFSLVAATRGLP